MNRSLRARSFFHIVFGRVILARRATRTPIAIDPTPYQYVMGLVHAEDTDKDEAWLGLAAPPIPPHRCSPQAAMSPHMDVSLNWRESEVLLSRTKFSHNTLIEESGDLVDRLG